jgi:hypothetical protein
MHSGDIIAYTYRADNYCPDCIIPELLKRAEIAAKADTSEGLWRWDVEGELDAIARIVGIDRQDENTFDSDDFPKVVFADMVEDEDERCGNCHRSFLTGELPDDAPAPKECVDCGCDARVRLTNGETLCFTHADEDRTDEQRKGYVLLCPECGEDVRDIPVGYKLPTCWNEKGHASRRPLSFDTMGD